MSIQHSPINIAVLGAGFGQRHIHGILNNPERFKLAMICEPETERVNTALKNIKNLKGTHFVLPSACQIVNDYSEALNNPEIQAVAVSLPHHLHEQVCVEAAQAKKHILVDKPLGRTLAETGHIIRETENNNVTLMVAFNYRFTPAYRKMRELLASGEIGKPLYAVTRHYQNFNPPASSNWRSKASVGGGCVIGSGVHNIDLMRWLLGEPEEVFAYGVNDPQRLEAEAAASIAFKYPSGLVVNFNCNWIGSGVMDGFEWGEWEVFGSTGDIAIHNGKLRIGHKFGDKVKNIAGRNLMDWIGDGCRLAGYENMWEHFADSIENGTVPLTSGPDAETTQALVLKVYESIEKGGPVKCQAAGREKC
ncbi:MAG: Gfo/Idh/MocA family oxidoreductase [Victivallales bacterium]